jgi:hypothetical protein
MRTGPSGKKAVDVIAVDKLGKPITRKFSPIELKKLTSLVAWLKSRGLTFNVNDIVLAKYKVLTNKNGVPFSGMQVHPNFPNIIRIAQSLWSENHVRSGTMAIIAHELGHIFANSQQLPSNGGNYNTTFVPGQSFAGYGNEQQGEIFRGLFMGLNGSPAGTQLSPNTLDNQNRVFTGDQYESIFSSSIYD